MCVLDGEVFPEEHQLLRLLEPDDAGEQVGPATIGNDPAANEHLDELRGVGGDDEVGRECDVCADTSSSAVDGADHRLLAVEDRGDETLGPAADVAAHEPAR